MAPSVDGHDAAPAHREHMGGGKSETLFPARGHDIKVLFKISLRVREARRGREQGTDGYADDV